MGLVYRTIKIYSKFKIIWTNIAMNLQGQVLVKQWKTKINKSQKKNIK